jgi:hypothetical protein
LAKDGRYSSTAAQIAVETVSAPGWFLELPQVDERDINWRKACQWRADRILRFIDRQKTQRAWVQFSELAEQYGRNIGIAEGYEQLKRAVIKGDFERDGRSRVLYLHSLVTKAKMTRENMRNVVGTHPPATVQRQYLACCWIPRELADEWWANQAASSDDQAAKEKRGRVGNDDDPALDEMHRLIQQEGCSSIREAAKQALAQGLARGIGMSKSTIDRLRRKYGARFPGNKRSRS